MLVSPTRASATWPFSLRARAATPTMAQACAVGWNFSYRKPQPGPSLGTRIAVRISPGSSAVVR